MTAFSTLDLYTSSHDPTPRSSGSASVAPTEWEDYEQPVPV
jgi:hypothetical protein